MSNTKLSGLPRPPLLVVVERTMILWVMFSAFVRPVLAAEEAEGPDLTSSPLHAFNDEQVCPPESSEPTPLDRLWERVALEPDVLTVQSWAVMQARAQPERAGQMLRDARARGALPMLRLRGRFGGLPAGRPWRAACL